MFSPDYVRLVLSENFADAKTLFLGPLMAVHYAHLVMLAETGIVSAADARALRDALDGLDLQDIRQAPYAANFEDLFFYLEERLAKRCGRDVAGRLHTARSRNDIDMTMYRLRLREWVLGLMEAVVTLRHALIDVAARHQQTLFPAHTHTQPAQPTTLAHYFLAVIEQLERDTARLVAAYARTNRSPLGACAITGTGFPIDRHRTATLLGFDAPTGNTYGSIAAVDHLLESAGAAGVTSVGLGRVVQDLLLWCTVEVGYLRLPDGLVQASSVMPQKRNPVALEHARALASKAAGQATAVFVAVHNTPFGDIVDTEDDLQPLVAALFKDATRAVALVAVAVAAAEFDVARMRARAEAHWVTLTELADTLAREHQLPFVVAHRIAAGMIAARRERADAPLGEVLAHESRTHGGREIRMTDEAVRSLLSPERFVAVRKTHGGPAPERTAEALEAARAHLAADEATLARLRGALAAAEATLKQAALAI